MVEPAADSGSFALIFGKSDVGGKIEEAASPILVKLAVFPENREDRRRSFL